MAKAIVVTAWGSPLLKPIVKISLLGTKKELAASTACHLPTLDCLVKDPCLESLTKYIIAISLRCTL